MNALKKVALLCALLPMPLLAQTAVSGTKVLDNTGAPLASGDWNFGGTAIPVAAGSFAGTVTAGTQTVTVTNGGTTYLTVPGVVIGSSAFSWNTFVVPTNAAISGMGTPQLACFPGSTFAQTDSTPSNKVWSCVTINGQNVWLVTNPPSPAPGGMYAGAGAPTFICSAPCAYIQSDASSQSQALWAIVARAGVASTNWQLQGGNGTFAAGGDLSGSDTSQQVSGLKSVPFCAGFTPTNGQFVQYTTGGSPSPCYGAATSTGSFTAGGDLSGSSSSQQVAGIHSVPLCTGFTPTNGQVLQYTTASSPDPCYTAAALPSTPTSVGLGSVTNNVQTQASIVPNTAPSAAQILIGNAGGTAYAPQTISVDVSFASTGHATVVGLEGVPFCAGFTPTNGQFVQYTTGGTPNPCYGAASTSGSFSAGGDLSGSSSSQVVKGINSVPLCTGFTPANGQVLQYTTTSSPDPCYTAASVSGTGQAGQYTTTTFSATPAFTASSNTNNSWAITLTGNVTGSTLASSAAGQYLAFKICQDSTGSRTFAWPTGFSAATSIFPTASTCTEQAFFWDGSAAQPLGPAQVTGSGLPAIWYGPTGSAPPTPPSGYIAAWFDSSDNAMKSKNSAGQVTAAVGFGTCSAGLVLTGISDSAAVTCSNVSSALGSGTGTAGYLACATGSNAMGNCTGTPPNNILGVFLTGGAAYVGTGQIASVVIDTAQNVTAGDVLCASSIAGKSHDNGSIACANGEWVGIVTTTASSVSTVTASLRLQ